MKKYIELLEDIKTTNENIKTAETHEQKLIDSYMKIADIKSRIEKKRALAKTMCENSEQIKNLKITRYILKNNAKIALFNEVIPVALELLKKYNGKPYGEKTKQKICDEVKEKTNCHFYIGGSWQQSYEVYPANSFFNEYNISCGTEYTGGNKKPLLIDNKIQAVEFSELALYYISREYVENVPERVDELKRLYFQAVKKQEELETICNAFNSLAVGDIPHIYKDKYIYKNMGV